MAIRAPFIWTKSKRAATFFRETVPDSPCHRESENQYKEDEKEDDGTKGGRENVQLGLQIQHAGL